MFNENDKLLSSTDVRVNQALTFYKHTFLE